eukprot:TRINITY_DN12814_c0_g1_i1.p1 TRINITY_DN12814_c0_g1~~TRINITY_DN12814_c0_g1_i1.p1  ORF type:complete len:109 (-),score=18.32 TRINITY_DN12814_c0_g1_i1:12-338(-)
MCIRDRIMSEEMVKELNLEPIARLVSFTAVGVEPRIMGIGPIKAIPKALKQAGLKQDQLELIAVSYTHLRAHETVLDLVCRLLLEKKKNIDHYYTFYMRVNMNNYQFD